MDWNKREVATLTAEVLEVLNRHDVYGLEPGSEDGPPIDEYLPEAMDMVSVLVKRAAITPADIRSIWVKWFSDDLPEVGPLVSQVAAELTALMDRRQFSESDVEK